MSDKAILNTTINQKILGRFREYCKKINCPMNVILEAFMEQFANGEFTIKIGKNETILDLED